MTISNDPYKDVLGALITKALTLTDFFNAPTHASLDRNNISRGHDYWLVFTPGAFPNTRFDGRDVVYQWQTPTDLFVRYKTEKESIPKLLEVRGVLLKTYHAPRAIKNLNITSIIVTGDRIKQDTPPPAKPNFLVLPLLITVNQIVKR